jgi:hypothetical protein
MTLSALPTRGLRVGFLPGKRSAPINPDRFLGRSYFDGVTLIRSTNRTLTLRGLRQP